MVKRKDYEDVEIAEEALAEKNINEAERLLSKEKNKKEEEYDEYDEITLGDRITEIEKKITAVLWLVVVTMVVALLTLVFVISGESGKTTTTEESGTPTESTSEYDVSAFKEIKAQDLKKASKGKTILVYIGRSSCGYCVQFVPVLTEVQKKYNSYTTYYIDIAKILDFTGQSGVLDEEANNIMKNLEAVKDQEQLMNENWGATPMTLVIKDSKIIDSLVGASDAATLENLVKNNGLTK